MQIRNFQERTVRWWCVLVAIGMFPYWNKTTEWREQDSHICGSCCLAMGTQSGRWRGGEPWEEGAKPKVVQV